MQIEKSPPPVSEAEMCPDFTGKTFTKKNTFVINLPRKSCIVCVIIDKKKQETKIKIKILLIRKKTQTCSCIFCSLNRQPLKFNFFAFFRTFFSKGAQMAYIQSFTFCLTLRKSFHVVLRSFLKAGGCARKITYTCAIKSSAFKLFCSLPGPGSVFIGNRKSALHCYVTYIKCKYE